MEWRIGLIEICPSTEPPIQYLLWSLRYTLLYLGNWVMPRIDDFGACIVHIVSIVSIGATSAYSAILSKMFSVPSYNHLEGPRNENNHPKVSKN